MRIRTAVGVAAIVVAVVAIVSLSPASRAEEPVIQFLNSPEMESLGLPFSEAVRLGDILFLSGQVGNLPGTKDLVKGGIAAETRQTLKNIRDVLERHGSSLDRVVKCTVFLADISEWPAMNEVYRTFFPGTPPARSAMAASGLALGARVEIECIAAAGRTSRAAGATEQEGESMGQKEHDLRIDYIELNVTDVARNKEFYQEVFGWKFTDYGPDYTSFNDGRLSGGLRADPEPRRGGPLIVIYATDLAGIEARIRDHGGTIVKETFEFPGGRRFHFTDPSGNELAVWSDK